MLAQGRQAPWCQQPAAGLRHPAAAQVVGVELLLRVPPSPLQVLFVLSADRPLTESEVRFLKYVRQWGKKVVFVVNKVRLPGPCRVAWLRSAGVMGPGCAPVGQEGRLRGQQGAPARVVPRSGSSAAAHAQGTPGRPPRCSRQAAVRLERGAASEPAPTRCTPARPPPAAPPARPPFAQCDILSSAAEVAEVVSFVKSNAARVLGVDDPQVLPVRCAARGGLSVRFRTCSTPARLRKAGSRAGLQRGARAAGCPGVQPPMPLALARA